MKKVRLLAAAAVLVGLGGAVAIKASRFDDPLPPPLVPLESLPTPAPEDNGWMEIAELGPLDTSSCDGATTIVRLAGEDTDAEGFWTDAVKHRDALVGCSDAHRTHLAAWARAAAAPAFVPLADDGEEELQLAFFYELVVVSVLARAVDEDWEDADRTLAAQLRLTSEALKGARTSLSAMAAASGLEAGLELAHLLTQKHGWSRFPRLSDEVSSLIDSTPDADFNAVMVGDYFRARLQLERRRASASGLDWWTFDPLHTARLLDTRLTRHWRTHGGVVLATDDEREDADCGWAARAYDRYGCSWYGPDAWEVTTVKESLDDSHAVRTRWLRRLDDALQRDD